MMTRRRFLHVSAATGASLALRAPSAGAQAANVRMGVATPVPDVNLTLLTAGQHPKVHFYRDEGLNLELVNMGTSAQALQGLVSGNAEFTTFSPPVYLNSVVRAAGLDLVSAYVWLRHVHWSIVVKPESPANDLRDLRGKRIGIFNTGDTGYFGARAMFRERALDPDKDIEWISVGTGAPAAIALDGGRVEALALWDVFYAQIENLGFKLRHLPNTPGMRDLFGATWGVRRSALKANRDLLVRMFRAAAKSTIFAAANPELAIRIHWQLYPESKPKGKTDADALREASHVIQTRVPKWLPAPHDEDKRMGASTMRQWQAQVRFVGLQDKLPDAATLFTNELLDEANRFDRAAIEDQARRLTL